MEVLRCTGPLCHPQWSLLYRLPARFMSHPRQATASHIYFGSESSSCSARSFALVATRSFATSAYICSSPPRNADCYYIAGDKRFYLMAASLYLGVTPHAHVWFRELSMKNDLRPHRSDGLQIMAIYWHAGVHACRPLVAAHPGTSCVHDSGVDLQVLSV